MISSNDNINFSSLGNSDPCCSSFNICALSLGISFCMKEALNSINSRYFKNKEANLMELDGQVFGHVVRILKV